jgi:TolB-like protein
MITDRAYRVGSFFLLFLLFPALPLAADQGETDRVVSVLYFEPLQENEEYAWLSKGLADALISELTAVEELTVVEREELQSIIEEQRLSLSGMTGDGAAAELGRMLGARHLVSGSYAVTGETARISCKVTAVESGEILSSTSLTAGTAEVPEVQRRLAAHVCGALSVPYGNAAASGEGEEGDPALTAGQSRPSLQAMSHYYRGLELYDQERYEEAAELLKKAMKAAPSYTKPRRTLEQCYTFLREFRRARQMRDLRELTELLEGLRRRLERRPFLSYAEVIKRLHAAGASPERIRSISQENPALLRGETPAQVVWHMQITMHAIARKSREYFGDADTARQMLSGIVTLSRTARQRIGDDPFYPEILYQELLVHRLRRDWSVLKRRSELLMRRWPDFRMVAAVEEGYERALEELH